MSTLRTITAFKSKLSGGGARPNLFEAEIPSFPVAAGANVWRTGDSQESDLFKFKRGANLLHLISTPFQFHSEEGIKGCWRENIRCMECHRYQR